MLFPSHRYGYDDDDDDDDDDTFCASQTPTYKLGLNRGMQLRFLKWVRENTGLK